VKLIGETKIETIDLPGELQFVFVRENGWLDVIPPPALAGALAAWCWISHSYLFSGLVLVVSVVYLTKSLTNPATVLLVSPWELMARGNVGGMFKDEIRIPVDEVRSLDYSTGGEDDIPGLYVWAGQKSCFLIRGLSQEQATDIAVAIRRKFPELEQGDPTPASILHGDQSGVLTLNLSSDPTNSQPSNQSRR